MRVRVATAIILATGLVVVVGLCPLLIPRFARWQSPLTLPVARCAVSLGLVRGESASRVRAAAALRRRSPTDEARAAANAGDYRLVGVAGFGVNFPGIPHDGEAQLSTQLGVRQILGDGDGGDVYSQQYQAASYDFALRYNRTLMQHQSGDLR